MTTHSVASSPARRWHILRPVQGESVPSRLLVFAIEPVVRELDGGVHEHIFRVGAGACYHLDDGRVVDRADCVFSRREDWYRWVALNRLRDRCTWVAAHNLVYCLTLLDWWRSLGVGGESLVQAILSDPPTILLTRSGRLTTRYVDCLNYHRGSLADLCRSSGRQPPPVSRATDSPDAAIERCRFKTTIVGDYLCRAIEIVRSNRLCAWQPTAPSMSFATWRHSYYRSKVWIHGSQEGSSLERRGLFGGRCQMWRRGSVTEPVTIVDANSLYPHAMSNYVLPVRFKSHQHGASVRELQQALHRFECIAAVRLGRSDRAYPRRVAGRIYWDGEPSTRVLAGAELRQAVGLGLVESVSELARYDAGMPFADFVGGLYPLKLSLARQADHAGASFIKLLLNGVVGKFSQINRRWVNAEKEIARGRWRTWYATDYHTGRPALFRNLGGLVQRYESGGECWHSFPAISAAITAAGRVEMARHLDAAGAAQVLYTDTDSLHVLPDGLDRLAASDLLGPTDLGLLKVVHRGDDAYYWGLKHYRVGHKYCCCYLTASAVQVAEGVYRDAARYHFDRIMQEGIADRAWVKERLVTVRDPPMGETLPLVAYGEEA